MKRPALIAYVGAVIATALIVTVAASLAGLHPPGRPSWATLPILGGLLVASEYLLIRFRYAGEINALNVVEAALAPLVFAFPVWAAALTVAAAMLAGDALRHNRPVKAAFNAGQWALSAGVAGVILSTAAGEGVAARSVATLLGALVVIGVLNQLMFTVVVALAQGSSVRNVLHGLAPVVVPGWLGGWATNVLFGLLFVFAYAAHPGSSVLFIAPLVMLHYAYRGYAASRSDRVRLAGLHRAARALAEPLEPADAVPAFLLEVARCFESRGAALVIADQGGWLIHTVAVDGRNDTTHALAGDAGLEVSLTRYRDAVRVGATHPLAGALRSAGWRECLYAPLLEDDSVAGGLFVYDQIGLEGFEDGELAVIEALARETAGAFTKGELVRAIVQERSKLGLIVDTTSDGIFTVAEDGLVKNWNAAMAALTDLPAEAVVDHAGALDGIDLRTDSGTRIRLAAWATGEQFPARVVITTGDGSVKRLSCSYSQGPSGDGLGRMLIVIARDVTTAKEIADLREDYRRLARAEASHRAVVDQLQEAVMPARPTAAGTDVGVAYLASDPSAPTGGDLYDWHTLASGEVHLAVIDVLGHGVSATKDALSVVHALRMLALQGWPFKDMVRRADEMLAAQKRDLVATVLVGRYNPYLGRLLLAGGGHPPPLLVTPWGDVRELPVPGGAIGWPGAGSETVSEIPLDSGCSVVLYTDGLVEAGRDIMKGMEELVAEAAKLGDLPAEALASRLLERSRVQAERADDALVLVLRRTPITIRTSWSIDAGPRQTHDLRKQLAAWFAGLGLSAAEVEDLQLMASELMTNAVEASASHIDVNVAVEPRSVSLEVEDDGSGGHDLEELGHALPAGDAERGRGLFIVRSIADHVSFQRSGSGQTVRVVRLLGSPLELIPPVERSRQASPA